MSIGDIKLSAAARANLSALKLTLSLAEVQDHLARGTTINSASDNAAAFFKSQGFLGTAHELRENKRSISVDDVPRASMEPAPIDALVTLNVGAEELLGHFDPPLAATDPPSVNQQRLRKLRKEKPQVESIIRFCALYSVSAKFVTKRVFVHAISYLVLGAALFVIDPKIDDIYSDVLFALFAISLADAYLVRVRHRRGIYGQSALEAAEVLEFVKKQNESNGKPGGRVKFNALYNEELENVFAPAEADVGEGAVA